MNETCIQEPASEIAYGLLQHARITTLGDVLANNASFIKQNNSTRSVEGIQDALLTIAAHAAQQMIEVSSTKYLAFGELGFVGLSCLLLGMVAIAVCLMAFLLAKQTPPLSPSSCCWDEKPLPPSIEESRDLSISRAPILAAPNDGKDLLLKARRSRRPGAPLTPGVDIVDAEDMHILHFVPGPGVGQSSAKGACCSLHVGAGGPLLASVEVGCGAAVFRDSKGVTLGRLEAAGAGGYAVDGLGSSRAILHGVFKDRSVTFSSNGRLLASTEVPHGIVDSKRPAVPEVLVSVAPGIDAGLVLCAALAADWLESALQGRRPPPPWGSAFPEYFRHRLNLVA